MKRIETAGRGRRTALLGLVALGVLLLARPAHAIDVRLEAAPVISFPMSSFIDGLVINVPADVGFVSQITDGQYQFDEAWVLDLSQKTGYGAAISLLLDDWEIRYEFFAMDFDELTVTHVAFADVSPDLALELNQTGSLGISEFFDSIFFHSASVGYRFTPYDWVVHPYFPFALGFAAAQVRNGSDTYFGFNIQLGAGVQWDVLDALRVGVGLRYVLGLYKLPQTSFSSVQAEGIRSAVRDQSLTEAVMEVFQTLDLSIHASYLF